jgi:hypothetical protein
MSMTLKPDILYGLTREEYGAIPAINGSLLKEMTVSPGKLDWRRSNPRETTANMLRGTAIELLACEPVKFPHRFTTAPTRPEELPEDFIVEPPLLEDLPEQYVLPPVERGGLPEHFVDPPEDWNPRTNVGKEWKAEQLAAGRVIVRPTDHEGGVLRPDCQALKDWKREVVKAGRVVMSPADIDDGRLRLDTTTGKKWAAEMRDAGHVVVRPTDWNEYGFRTDTGPGQAWKAHMERQGVHVFNSTDMACVRGASAALLEHPVTAALIAAGEKQVAVVWPDLITGQWCKGLIDLYIPEATQHLIDVLIEDAEKDEDGEVAEPWMIPKLGEPLVPDIKTTAKELNDDSAEKLAGDLYWYWQGAMYLDGLTVASGRPHWWFADLVVEQLPVHRVEVYIMHPTDPDGELALGRAEYQAALHAYSCCEQDGTWPTSSRRLKRLRLPGWKWR